MSVADTVRRLRAFGAGASGCRAAGTSHVGLGPQDAAELVACLDTLATRQRDTLRLDGTRKPGLVLAELRRQRGLSRGELITRVAARTGVQAESIRALLWRWETGKVRSPELSLFDAFLQELGYGVAVVPLPAPAPEQREAAAC